MRGLAFVRRENVLGLIVDTVLHFVLAVIFSGARLFGGYAPFAVGFTAAAGTKRRGIAALLGSTVGALLFLDFTHALRTIAAVILLYVALSSLAETKLAGKKYFLPLLTVATMLAVEFAYVIGAGAYEAAYCLVSLLLAGLSAYCCKLVLRGDESPFARTVVMLGLLMSFSAYETRDGFAPGRIVSMLAVLLIAFGRERASAIPTGLCVGLAVDLAAGGGEFLHTAVYALAALAVSMVRRGDRVYAAIAFALTVLSIVLPLNAQQGLILLYEALAATLIFLTLPLRTIRGKRLAEDKKPEDEALSVRTRLEQSAAAFREVYESLSNTPEKPVQEDPAHIFDRAAERVCRTCSLRDVCWEKEYQRTHTALNDATAALVQKGEGCGEDFSAYFVDRCIRFPSFLGAVNAELREYLLRSRYRKDLTDSRALSATQYAQVSEVLFAAAGGLTRSALAVTPLAYEIGAALRPKKGERVSGDSKAVFEAEDSLCLLLSDGMGSGEAARKESALAVHLLERFLRAGIDAQPALKTLNSALTLRASETGSFTTVDLLQLSLRSGEGELYKYGAAPSYIKRGGAVHRVTCSCLPAGLQECSQPPEVTHLRLEAGTFFVMVTDGVADATSDEWLQNLLAGWQGENPQLLVSAILADSIERTQEADDAGVLVLYLPNGGANEIAQV